MDLISARTNNFKTLEEVKHIAPSIFNNSHFNSERYKFFSTIDAIDILDKNGFAITDARQKIGRTKKSHLTAQHCVRFAKKNQDLMDENFNEIILYNSADGDSALKLFVGNFRWICSNNLVSGKGTMSKLKHLAKNDFQNLLNQTLNHFEKNDEIIQKFKRTTLSNAEIKHLAVEGLKNRFDYAPNSLFYKRDEETNQFIENVYFDDFTVGKILEPNRVEDCTQKAWEVFNTVQENIFKSLPIISINEKGVNKNRLSRKVTNLKDDLKINCTLWDVTKEIVLN